MNHAKIGKIMKNHEIMPAGTPVLCTFDSVDFVGSKLSVWNCFVDNNAKHLSVYFVLFIIATLLPLSCFMMMSSRLDKLLITLF